MCLLHVTLSKVIVSHAHTVHLEVVLLSLRDERQKSTKGHPNQDFEIKQFCSFSTRELRCAQFSFEILFLQGEECQKYNKIYSCCSRTAMHLRSDTLRPIREAVRRR